MELKKNQEILLTIEDFTREGEGLGKYQGFPLFVKDTVIGDKGEGLRHETKEKFTATPAWWKSWNHHLTG